MKKQYQEPKAQHWVVLRLVRQSFKDHKGGHSRTTGQSTLWLIREVGIKQVMSMIEQLEKEEV
jgi:hypothetical protein